MVLQTYCSTVHTKTLVANNILHLTTTKPDGFTYVPGQFVLWQVPDASGSTLQPRAYSIASHPSQNQIDYIFKYEAGGRASEWIQHTVAVGTPITFQRAMGTFCLPQSLPDSLVFVATSTGIAPIASILQELVNLSYKGEVLVLFGVRTEQDLFWQVALQQLVVALPAATLLITLSKPSVDWQGEAGRVQVQLANYKQLVASSTVYACGNPVMTKEVKTWCTDTLGIPKKSIHIEGFI